MKTILILILTLFIFNLFPNPQVKVIEVIDYRRFKRPPAFLECHKDGDVEFYRLTPPKTIPFTPKGPSEAYWIGVYKVKDKKLVFHTDWEISCDWVIDSVRYKWVNDSTLKYQFIDHHGGYPPTNMYFVVHNTGSNETIPGTNEPF
jgi:hypothetical protein